MGITPKATGSRKKTFQNLEIGACLPCPLVAILVVPEAMPAPAPNVPRIYKANAVVLDAHSILSGIVVQIDQVLTLVQMVPLVTTKFVFPSFAITIVISNRN